MASLGGQQQGQFQDSSGTQLEYLYAAPDTTGQPVGLLILLHGSNKSSYDRFVGEMQPAAEQLNLMPVSVLAPNGQGWNEGQDQGQRQAAEALDQLVRNKLFKDFNIDKNRVFFSGQSSGGGFLSSHFVPLKAANYTGGAFFQCGQMPPEADVAGTVSDHKRFALHVKINSDDSWMDYYGETEKQYRQLGFPFTSDTEGTGGHCNFDQAETIAKMLPQMESSVTKPASTSDGRTVSSRPPTGKVYSRPTGPRKAPERNERGEKILGT